MPVDMQTGFNLLCDNRYIFLAYQANSYIYEECDIFEGKEVILTETMGIIVKKGFPYREVMTKL